jgi:hypothetical protein
MAVEFCEEDGTQRHQLEVLQVGPYRLCHEVQLLQDGARQ